MLEVIWVFIYFLFFYIYIFYNLLSQVSMIMWVLICLLVVGFAIVASMEGLVGLNLQLERVPPPLVFCASIFLIFYSQLGFMCRLFSLYRTIHHGCLQINAFNSWGMTQQI